LLSAMGRLKYMALQSAIFAHPLFANLSIARLIGSRAGEK